MIIQEKLQVQEAKRKSMGKSVIPKHIQVERIRIIVVKIKGCYGCKGIVREYL